MITFNSVFFILTILGFEVRSQYLLKEYAPNHDNYESGDHKYHWKRMDHSYDLEKPDASAGLVQYTAGPNRGFEGKVAVGAVAPKYTKGNILYENRDNESSRYASKEINQYQENILGIGNILQPGYEQKVDLEQINSDYVNEESRKHVIISRSTNNTSIPNHQNKNVNLRRKHIVKKQIETDAHSTGPGLEYISNFNLNPISIDQLNIPDGERKIIQELSIQNQPSKTIPLPVHSPKPFALPYSHLGQSNIPILNLTPQFHQAQIIPTKVAPNGEALINTGRYTSQSFKNQPKIPVNYKGNEPNYGEQKLNQALSSIHSQPEVKLRLEKLHNRYNIPQGQPLIQGKQRYEETPRTGNYQHLLVANRPQNQQTYSENIPQQIHQTSNNYGQYQQNHRGQTYGDRNLSRQNSYPLIFIDTEAKLGLPFYPSSHSLDHAPQEEFNYEGIPHYNPELEGKRYNNENQTAEEKARQRQYLLGLSPGPLFAPPPGYTRETIWQAGDPDAGPDVESMTLQLNQTCAYIQWNETTPGNEDGRPNIWQAGDYSAQLENEEYIRSANITCENYTADALANFSSGYTIIDYCYQCVKNDGSFYAIDEKGNKVYPSYIPTNFGPNNEQNQQQQQEYVQSEVNIQQQIEEQLPANYEINAEEYKGQQNTDDSTLYASSQGNYGQETQSSKMNVYPNLGYRNDPQSSHYGLYRRRNANRQSSKSENNSNRKQV